MCSAAPPPVISSPLRPIKTPHINAFCSFESRERGGSRRDLQISPGGRQKLRLRNYLI